MLPLANVGNWYGAEHSADSEWALVQEFGAILTTMIGERP